MSKCNQSLIEAWNRGARVNPDGSVIGVKGKPVKPNTTGRYLKFNLSRGRPVFVHRLQAYQKFGERLFQKGVEVRHLDGNSFNNSWDNLELGSHKENMKDKPKATTVKAASIAGRSNSKLTVDDVKEIRKLKQQGLSLRVLAEQFSISKGNVSDIVNRKLYKDVT